MLRLSVTVHDQEWPKLCITITRESMANGMSTTQEKIQYDLAYDKAEVMCHNQLRLLIQEIVGRRKQKVSS